MYQKWPDQIFPIVNFVFPTMVTLVWGGGEGVLREGSPPHWFLIILKKPCPAHAVLHPRGTRAGWIASSQGHRHPLKLPCSTARRDALEREGPRGRPQRRLERRLEEVAEAVGGGYCQLRMPLRLALGARGTVARHRLGALEGYLPPFLCIPDRTPP